MESGNKNFQLGLLHFAHLLVMADGVLNKDEEAALVELRKEEQMPEALFQEFMNAARSRSEKDIYDQGVKLLNACSEEEKLRAMVQLYRLSEADEKIHVKEVRFLFYSIQSTSVSFDDVVMATSLLKSKSNSSTKK